MREGRWRVVGGAWVGVVVTMESVASVMNVAIVVIVEIVVAW